MNIKIEEFPGIWVQPNLLLTKVRLLNYNTDLLFMFLWLTNFQTLTDYMEVCVAEKQPHLSKFGCCKCPTWQDLERRRLLLFADVVDWLQIASKLSFVAVSLFIYIFLSVEWNVTTTNPIVVGWESNLKHSPLYANKAVGDACAGVFGHLDIHTCFMQ